uniref:Uncharacterized protein n=1 Tax=Nothobranchius furzeri TaxID=105023 RepID=A0A8C6MEX9_NOTFU
LRCSEQPWALGDIAAAHQSREGSKVISKQFGVHYSTVKELIQKWKPFKTVANLLKEGNLWDAHPGHKAPVPSHPKDTLSG